MRLNPMCIRCLIDRQEERLQKLEASEEKKTAYMKEVAAAIGSSDEESCAPFMVYEFNKIYRRYFGEVTSYAEVKKEYNQYVLEMEADLQAEIEKAEDPLAMSLVFARIGNYIDFGAMQHVDKQQFLELFEDEEKNTLDAVNYEQFLLECERGKNFLLATDNCGEIVLDKLFIVELRKRFPHLNITVLVKGGEVLNDAVMEDAVETGMCHAAKVIDNGNSAAGNIEKLLSAEAVSALDNADVILAKGQANFETMNGTGRNIYFSFLCKCQWFSTQFKVPQYTGMFLREKNL